jgi:thiamine kinase-like enzyme
VEPAPSLAVAARAARLLGWTPASWRPIGGGYTPAARYVASAAGERAFVKVATTPLTAEHLRREGFVYERLGGPFMPGFIGWEDHEREPILVIEDLSQASWPPPWKERSPDAVLEQIDAMHATPAQLRSFSAVHGAVPRGWATVAQAPGPFLALGLTSREWLVRALPKLTQAEAACPVEGASIAHFDLRSDNICFSRGRAIFIDWGEACLSNAKFDLGFWLPSLAFEGGPRPQTILPNEPEIAAKVSGFFAAHAGLPAVPGAPFVRRVQREQLTTSLPWACAALRLGSPLS